MMLAEKKDFEIDPNLLNIPKEILDHEFLNYEEFYSFIRNLLITYDKSKVKYAIYILRSQSAKDKYTHAEYVFQNDILNLLNKILIENIEDQAIVVSIF